MTSNPGRSPRSFRYTSKYTAKDFNEQADWYYRAMRHLSFMLVCGSNVWDEFNIAAALFELADNYHKREVHRCQRPTMPYKFP